jgi:hypothetical protein
LKHIKQDKALSPSLPEILELRAEENSTVKGIAGVSLKGV